MGGVHRRYLSLMAHGMRTWEGQGKGEMGKKVMNPVILDITWVAKCT